jgi:rhodanese-related sulfurtransferase
MIRKRLRKFVEGLVRATTPPPPPQTAPVYVPAEEEERAPAETQAPAPTPTPEPTEEAEPEPTPPDMECDGAEALAWFAEGRPPLLVDIREPHEVQGGHAQGAFLLPMNQVPQCLGELPRDQKLVVYCAAGARSYGVVGFLRENGFSDSWSLSSGYSGWVAAGGEHTRPDANARFKILQPVRLTEDAVDRLGAQGNAGTVQGVTTHEGLTVYAVRVRTEDGGSEWVDQLEEGDLVQVGMGSP